MSTLIDQLDRQVEASLQQVRESCDQTIAIFERRLVDLDAQAAVCRARAAAVHAKIDDPGVTPDDCRMLVHRMVILRTEADEALVQASNVRRHIADVRANKVDFEARVAEFAAERRLRDQKS